MLCCYGTRINVGLCTTPFGGFIVGSGMMGGTTSVKVVVELLGCSLALLFDSYGFPQTLFLVKASFCCFEIDNISTWDREAF